MMMDAFWIILGRGGEGEIWMASLMVGLMVGLDNFEEKIFIHVNH